MNACKFVQVPGTRTARIPTLHISARRRLAEGRPMDIQTFDMRQPVALDDPSGIKPDDWLEDLGTLRQVDYVDTLSMTIGPGTLTIRSAGTTSASSNAVVAKRSRSA